MSADALQARKVNWKLDRQNDDDSTREEEAKLNDSVNVTIAFDSLCITSHYDVSGKLVSFIPVSGSGTISAVYFNVTAKVQVSLVHTEDASPRCNEREKCSPTIDQEEERMKRRAKKKKLTLEVHSIDYGAVEMAIESLGGRVHMNSSQCNCNDVDTRAHGHSETTPPSQTCADEVTKTTSRKTTKDTRYQYASVSSESESDESIATFSRMLFWRLVLSMRLHMQHPLTHCIEKVM